VPARGTRTCPVGALLEVADKLDALDDVKGNAGKMNVSVEKLYLLLFQQVTGINIASDNLSV
jgi:hypothetical protein